jgi:hypothetical protein
MKPAHTNASMSHERRERSFVMGHVIAGQTMSLDAIGWIEQALAPLRGQLSAKELR